MNIKTLTLAPADTDDAVDDVINFCLNPKEPKSFFLYAGAGSGKTRSLKHALENFREKYGYDFRRTGKKVAVITYTNAAVDEIASRVGQDPLFPITTIHSFCWSQISSYHNDIKIWLLADLQKNLDELRNKQAKGRAGTKAALDRERAIVANLERQNWLSMPRQFTYNPNGDNFGKDSLTHSEVLKIFSAFVISKPSMQAVLINKFPFILIDESQDTSKILMDAFFVLAAANTDRFALGLFGDTMQRIFADGKPDLGKIIPMDWERPVKKMNHRSPQRVIQLGNSLRSVIDNQQQLARDDSEIGIVRLFILSNSTQNKPEIEQQIRTQMAEICKDEAWKGGAADVKILTLEHHMAAARCGFLPMFQALDSNDRLSTGLRDGSLAGLRLFTKNVAPVLAANTTHDKFNVMAHLRKTSPLLQRTALSNSVTPDDPLHAARQAIEALATIITDDPATRFLDVLQCVFNYGLFEIPASLRPFLETTKNFVVTLQDSYVEESKEEGDEVSSSSLEAWRAFLETPYNQIIPYTDYINDSGQYGTHQGVKGREFERVFVVMDDSDARGFLFSYEKLFGAKPLSDGDRQKAVEGEETGIDRTRRLLYVTCTRAEKSLALVAYTDAPEALAFSVVNQGWFEKDELISIDFNNKENPK